MRTKRCLTCGHTHECKNRKKLPSRLKQKQHTWTREKDGHTYEYLVGAHDHVKRRVEIFVAAGGNVIWYDPADNGESIEEIQPATCQGCAEPHLVGWYEGDWFHNSKTKGGRRCDCKQCSLFTCKPFHIRYHNRVIAVRQIA